VYLNGAILGMSRSEIARKFDDIVAFADVAQFLDTPVKRYSSGMYVRLAFSVAVHLEPDVLVVDEVLAVGDTVFQKKCIDRMTEVSRDGRTVLFVTHNLAALRALCRRSIVFEAGKIVYDGSVEEGIRHYQPISPLRGRSIDLRNVKRTEGARELRFDSIEFKNAPVKFGEPIKLALRLRSDRSNAAFGELDFGINIKDNDGNNLIHCSNRFVDKQMDHDSDEREYFVEIENILRPNIYSVTLFLRTRETIQDWLTDVASFEVSDGNPYGYFRTSHIQGAVMPGFTFLQK
jgi:lipopolysaccharide transport system ATP-binding protein